MAENDTEKIYELLRSFDTAILVTHVDPDGLRARPMAIARIEKNCDLWFFTGRESSKVHEIEQERKVLIVCQKNHSHYLSVSGKGRLINDRARIRELWKESYRTWFPRGVDDPDILLITVQVEEAEYWDNQGLNGIRYAFQAAKAYVTGTRPEVKEGSQHERVALK